ncbi:MAG: PleD family two-component system response regulator [Gammaproteobacteria bacterium]|nr:PleD family two-component system response regulator [Gammaproteobacteria bacterium]MBU1656457.1 PleD family two-component system response regulator [Gammaproteobacteria bacterium]MBU1962254.1 PleD family two-component system response regulator [Gammaproteobacteria bacterium]
MSDEKARVFIVEDSKTSMAALKSALSGEFRIATALSGQEALKAIPKVNPDLILLDVVMPGMDGFEVCRRLKENPAIDGTPIVFVTAKESVEDETRGLEMGAADYITKPISPPVVRARVRNLIQLKRYRDRLFNLSAIDGLTGIPNRRRFDEQFDSAWRQSFRRWEPISLLMVDIDSFKLYNDNYGHLAGDECIKQVALLMKGMARRAGDFAARYGGEEFACVLSETDIQGAREFAQRLLEGIRELKIPHAFSPAAEVVTASIGVATVIPRDPMAPEELLEAADHALYDAKRLGRNRYAVSNFT